jgi:DNA-directed RNA polymerase specialized sigma24 family protein
MVRVTASTRDAMEHFGRGSEECLKAEDGADSFREQIISLLPRLSALAHCLTGNAGQRDDLVLETCARTLAHKHQWQPGTRLDIWMFRIAHDLWFDQQRAKKFRSEPADIEMADHLVGGDGRAATEGGLVLADLLMGARSALAGAAGVDRVGERLRPQVH